jgi:hypothetical protein
MRVAYIIKSSYEVIEVGPGIVTSNFASNEMLFTGPPEVLEAKYSTASHQYYVKLELVVSGQ